MVVVIGGICRAAVSASRDAREIMCYVYSDMNALISCVDCIHRYRNKRMSTPVSRDAVLITGGRGGIGRAVAEGLSAMGYTAIVTVRKLADVDAI